MTYIPGKDTYWGSLLKSAAVGEFSATLSILTGCFLTQERKMS